MVTFISIGMLITLIIVYDVPTGLNNDGKDKRVKRLVGGSEAPIGAFPYQISLRTAIDDSHFCSGSILRPSVILTAAHCVKRENGADLIVVAGTNKLSSGGTRHNVIMKVAHENFDTKTLKNDIAVLFIFPPLSYSNTIKSIELDHSHIGDGIAVTLSGWGKTSFNGINPDKLQFLNTTTINVTDCQKKSIHKDAITNSTICTLTKPGEGACTCDSGGPLVAHGKQVGIVSWGEKCAAGYPDIYTRVAPFIPWIKKKIIDINNIVRMLILQNIRIYHNTHEL